MNSKVKINIDLNHPGQERFLDFVYNNNCPNTLNYYIAKCPRQWGKSYIARLVILQWAIQDPGSKLFWITTSYNMANEHFTELLEDLQYNTQIIKDYSKGDYTITLTNNSKIYFRSQTNYDALRGYSMNYAVCDEYSFWNEESYDTILKALRSVGKKCLIISTPLNKNRFYEDYSKGLNTEIPNYFNFSGTNEENPRFNTIEFNNDKQFMTPNKFRSECLAEFIEDGGSVFENINKCTVLDNFQDPIDGNTYYAGLDLGKTNDFTVLTIIDQDFNVVYIDRFTGLPFLQQAERISYNLNKYQAYTYIETNIESTLYEILSQQYDKIYDWRTTHNSKEQLVSELQLRLQTCELKLPTVEPALQQDLEMFDQSISRSKNIIYGARRGFHDDCVISLGLALQSKKEFMNSFIPEVYRV